MPPSPDLFRRGLENAATPVAVRVLTPVLSVEGREDERVVVRTPAGHTPFGEVLSTAIATSPMSPQVSASASPWAEAAVAENGDQRLVEKLR
jgi:hypothetical protein